MQPSSPGKCRHPPPNIGGTDLAVAPGRKYIAVANPSRVTFYDRSGTQKWTSPVWTGGPSGLFAPIFDPAQLSINTKERFTLSDKLQCSSNIGFGGLPPFPAWGKSFKCAACGDFCRLQNSCVNEAYEVRLAYDCRLDRYVIQHQLRNELWYPKQGEPNDDPCKGYTDKNKQLIRRHIAFAVSNSAEPSQGFRYYWLPNDHGDMPGMAISGAYLVATHVTEAPPLDHPYVTLIDWANLVGGGVPEGAISAWSYKAADFGLPNSGYMGMLPSCNTVLQMPMMTSRSPMPRRSAQAGAGAATARRFIRCRKLTGQESSHGVECCPCATL